MYFFKNVVSIDIVMKNKILLNTCLIVFFALTMQVIAMAYSTGPPDGHNGQPPSGASCGLVALCHGADPVSYIGIEILIEGNPTEYIPGEIYSIEVFINDPFSDCFGFQLGAQFEDEIKSAGDFSINSLEDGISVSKTGNFQYVEHNEPNKFGRWKFLWTAPSGNALSDVVFYAAGVVADCNGEPVNDPTYTGSKKILSGCKSIEIAPVMQKNALLPRCDYSKPLPSIAIDFEPISGGSGVYTLITEGNSLTDKTALYEGDVFTYFYTESDIQNNTIGITIVDDEGHVCKLGEDIINLLSNIPVGVLCQDVSSCESAIEANIATGEWNNIFNCISNEAKLSITVSEITGGSGGYKILSLNGDEITTVSANESFNLGFNQTQINALKVGFTVEDANGCTEIFDLSDKVIDVNIADICSLTEPCSKQLTYLIDGGADAPTIKCNPINPTNPIYTIDVKNVIGGDGSYLVTAKGGALTESNLTEGESFIYVFTKATIETKKAIITIADENGCSSILDFNLSLAGLNLNALCDCTIDYQFETVENSDELLVACADEENEIYNIVITNVTGGNGDYDFSTSLGEVEVIETIPAKILLKFTKSDYDSGKLNFTIKSDNCSSTNQLPNLAAVNFEELCKPIIPVCNLELALSFKTDLSCNEPTATIAVATNAADNQSIIYTWQHNNLPISVNSNEGQNLASGTYTIIAEDEIGCKSEPLIVEIDELTEFRLLINEPYTCSFDYQFYNQKIFYVDAVGSLSIAATNGKIGSIASDSFILRDVPNGEFSDIEITDEDGCKQTLRVGPHICIDNSDYDCDANAGAMLPVPFDVFCTLNAEVTLPIQYGYNTALDYGFLITDKNLNIIGFSDDSKIDISGNEAGIYCIHGVSFNKGTPNEPDFTAKTLTELYDQPNVCFDITLEDCIEIELQAATTNAEKPIGFKDTVFLCTGYTTPIDFCIPLTDADGGKPYLVDIISFCNPTIEGDNCVHYPPLPGLVLGADETLSLIFCDDDCPQKCDTSYVNVSIREDCSGYEEPYLNDFFCGLDTIQLCTNPATPINLCTECDEDVDSYFIRDVRSIAGGNFEPLLSNNCINYLPKDEEYMDVVEIDLCLWDMFVCLKKVFAIEITEDCGNIEEPEICVEQEVCSLPTVLVEVCFDCEASKHPDAKITEIESLFDNCTTDEVKQMCFDYRPLPLMYLVGIDTVEVTYCNPNDTCFSTNVYLTFEDCDGLATELQEAPILIENNITIEASNDYFEISSTEETAINVLLNDAGENVNDGEVYVNIITAPQNGSISYNNTLNDISYTPNPNYSGNDSFLYEICNNGVCDRALANIKIEDEISNIESNLNIAPNPVTDYLYIDYTSASNQKINVHLFSAIGQVVYNIEDVATNNQYQNHIDLSNIERGIYFIRIAEGKKISTQKIIVQ